jgi:transcriptional regulator with XRE-family HTH domain
MPNVRKPKPPLSAWIVEQRNRQTPIWKSEELARRLGVSDSTVRGWEAGRSVSEPNLVAMERLFGVEAPGRDQSSPDDVAAALDRQTDVFRELIRETQRRAGAAERRADLLERLVVSLLEPAARQAASPAALRVMEEWGRAALANMPSPQPENHQVGSGEG